MSYWFLAINNQPEGPLTAEEVVGRIRSHSITAQTLAFTQGMSDWTPLSQIPRFHPLLRNQPQAPPPMPAVRLDRALSHEIDYEVYGDDMQFVEIRLDPQETVIAEAGAMMYMSAGIHMETQFGDGSRPETGFFDKVLDAGKRVLTGESLFMTNFTCRSPHAEKVAFAAPYPGKIVPLDLPQFGGSMICQKDAFVCAAKGTRVGIAFSRKIGRGLFGGEGFILQKLEGGGMAFIHAGGTIYGTDMPAGQTLRVDTGCLVAFQPSVSYDIQFTGGIKNTLFGGEGLFLATLTGPGKVFLQSLPFSRLADRVYAAAPKAGGSRKGEGSLLGGLGGLMDGDND